MTVLITRGMPRDDDPTRGYPTDRPVTVADIAAGTGWRTRANLPTAQPSPLERTTEQS